MSDRPEVTAVLSLSIQKHINPHNDPRIYWAKEVTFDYATSMAVRVDLASVRKAVRRDRGRPVSEMLLMMFRSATREKGER